MTEEVWQRVKRSLRKGRSLKGGAYRVLSCDEKRVRLERVKTGSVVVASRGMIERTAARLESGESIPFRSISYTVAIETAVVAALDAIGAVAIDADAKTYNAKGGQQ